MITGGLGTVGKVREEGSGVDDESEVVADCTTSPEVELEELGALSVGDRLTGDRMAVWL